MFWSVLHCTYTGVLAFKAIVTVFKNSFLITPPSEKKKKKTEKEWEMYVADDSK